MIERLQTKYIHDNSLMTVYLWIYHMRVGCKIIFSGPPPCGGSKITSPEGNKAAWTLKHQLLRFTFFQLIAQELLPWRRTNIPLSTSIGSFEAFVIVWRNRKLWSMELLSSSQLVINKVTTNVLLYTVLNTVYNASRYHHMEKGCQ